MRIFMRRQGAFLLALSCLCAAATSDATSYFRMTPENGQPLRSYLSSGFQCWSKGLGSCVFFLWSVSGCNSESFPWWVVATPINNQSGTQTIYYGVAGNAPSSNGDLSYQGISWDSYGNYSSATTAWRPSSGDYSYNLSNLTVPSWGTANIYAYYDSTKDHSTTWCTVSWNYTP
jgi:hypothetical protein